MPPLWAATPMSGAVSPQLPAYEVIDYLEAYGCAYATLRALRPQTHADLRSAVFAEGAEQCQAPEWLLRERQWLFAPFLPLEAAAGTLLTRGDAVELPGVEASVTPLFPLRQGRPTYEGANLYGELSLGLAAGGGERLGMGFGGTLGLAGAFENYERVAGRFYLQEGYLKAGYGWAELLFGKQSLGFGDARHGTLLLSQAAAPLPLWMLTLRPHIPRGFFSFLGPVSVQTFLADLGESEFVSGAKLWGVALALRPARWLELAWLNLNQFGGDGAPEVGVEDLLRMLVYSGAPELDAKRHRAMGIHLAVWAGQAKLYTQWYFENLGNPGRWFTDDLSVLGGLLLPRLGKTDLRVEYVRTVPGAYQDDFWKQGLSHRGTFLGHPLGPDGEGIYADLGLSVFSALRPEISFFSEKRSRGAEFPESRLGAGLTLRRRWARTAVEAALRYARVRNQSFQDVEDTDLLSARVWLRYSFL